ncbi:MAG: 2Fe-2S iron-sulfur cluster binding domain-containing protein [Clostridia bacterium]|nr:2Fe-2S iron-sulfur cluster binding domain-containing protein [Clostridia bacterium]NLF20559.1 2Fe-2S iron-sulfur cluster binding domain-containing protein [Clostridiaceae bacterium]
MWIPILQTTGSVTLISVVLAIVISFAEKLLNNYGTCKIDINDGEKVLEVEGGSSLLSTLAAQKIFIPSACGGKATCGLCKVQVKIGAGPLLPTEEPYLSAKERTDQFRLACQIKVKNDMTILIPPELFSIKEYIGLVEKITDLTHDIKRVSMKLQDNETISFKAGQFVQFYTKPYGKISETVFRAYSVASPPADNTHVDLIIRKVPDGIATGYAHTALKEGDEVRLSGPYGDFYRRGGEGVNTLVMIAGGSGMAPMYSLIYDIIGKGLDYQMYYFFGAVTTRDIFYLDEFRALEKEHPNFHFIPALSGSTEGDGWTGEKGTVVDVMLRHIPNADGKEAYLCGGPGMLNASTNALRTIGFTDETIFFDKF